MKTLIFITFLGFTIASFSQQIIENPGFEDWEDAGTVSDEPVDWSSIKTSDNDLTNPAAPVVWELSTDAHNGNYSVLLKNMAVFSIVATGTMTNGRVHAEFNPDSGYVYTDINDERWHTQLTARPDSLAGWYKFFPVENDRCRIRAILHVNEGSLPPRNTQSNWIADAEYNSLSETVDTWARFSIPFEYISEETPEFILIVFNSGDGLEAVEGSIALFDDLELIYNPGAIDKIPEETAAFYFYNDAFYFKSLHQEFDGSSLFQLTNLNGKIIFQQKISGDLMKIDTNFPEGIYIGSIISEKGIISRKILIQ